MDDSELEKDLTRPSVNRNVRQFGKKDCSRFKKSRLTDLGAWSTNGTRGQSIITSSGYTDRELFSRSYTFL